MDDPERLQERVEEARAFAQGMLLHALSRHRDAKYPGDFLEAVQWATIVQALRP